MANSKLNGDRYAYASIDTAPGAAGYWCDSVSMAHRNANELFASVSGGGLGTVVLQYKLPHTGSAWLDYNTTETLTSGARFRLDDHGAGVKWRFGMKEDSSAVPLTVALSGTLVVGFDW